MDNIDITYKWDKVPEFSFSEERYNAYSHKSSPSCDVVSQTSKLGMVILFSLFNMNVEASGPETKFSVPDSDNCSLIDNYVRTEIALNREFLRDQWKNEVTELTKLMDNWDGEGACRMSTTSIQHAMSILDNVYSRVELIDDIYPNPNGFVSIQWKNDKNDIISLELGRKQMSYFCKIKSNKEFVNRKDISFAELSSLFSKLASL